MGLKSRELLEFFLSRSVKPSLFSLKMVSSLSFPYSVSRSPRNSGSDDTCKRHSDAQVRVEYSTLGTLSTV